MHAIKNGLLYILAIGVSGYAIFVYGLMPLGALLHPDMTANFRAHSTGILVHIFASAIALLLGPFQFSARLRRLHPRVHRWIGRVYLGAGVLVGGVSGLYMSQFAYGGLMAKCGFALLAVLWLHSGLRAYLAIRHGDVDAHRKWMIRNFALTFAAVTLRLYLPASMIAGIELSVAYPFIAWLCWVPNAFVAEQFCGTAQRSS